MEPSNTLNSQKSITLSMENSVGLETLIDALQQNFTIQILDTRHFSLSIKDKGQQRFSSKLMFSTTDASLLPVVRVGAPIQKSLKPRDIRILQLLDEGCTYQEISQQMNISVNGMRYYIKKIYRMLGASNSREALHAYTQLQSSLMS
ncbi:helix-turn-helix transcriptional regulator [Arundinibacter roseus]|uniref:LuxR family transcriptional regulator n=1 Tax=Arundinibacter roseus TaxID=2070510 RepID=A0A4R4KKA8_9BACT|nr:helix-turn-helix transcriptional regulator [Arundinibacter roseus]TDB67362.1 LuxR family transcriptional regulator [Arundinibacter roseus]